MLMRAEDGCLPSNVRFAPGVDVRRLFVQKVHHNEIANSRYRQNALASCIWRGVRHSTSNRRGDATTMQIHFAREVATFSLLELYKNSMPRGASEWLDV